MTRAWKPGRSTKPSRPGFTLVEVVVSISIMSILVVAMGSAIVLTTHALPDANSPNLATIKTTRVINEISADLRYAVTFTERTTNAVEFTVADRNSPPDSVDETIRYEWSGTPGDPLTRQYNGGTSVAVLDNVQQWVLSYSIQTVGEQVTNLTESSELELISLDSGSSISQDNVLSDEWWGQYFKPSLPADATEWQVTRVLVRIRSTGSGSTPATLELRPPKLDNTPETTVLEAKVVDPAMMPTVFTWREFTFGNVSGLLPASGLCLTTISSDTAGAVQIEYKSAGVTLPDSGLLQSSSGEGAWNIQSDKGLLFYVYGTYTTPSTQTVNRDYLVRAGMTLQVAGGADEVQLMVPILTRPDVTP